VDEDEDGAEQSYFLEKMDGMLAFKKREAQVMGDKRDLEGCCVLVLMAVIKLSAWAIEHASKLIKFIFSITYNFHRNVAGGEKGPLSSPLYQYSPSCSSFSSPTAFPCTAGWVRRCSHVGRRVTHGRYVKYSYPPSLPPTQPRDSLLCFSNPYSLISCRLFLLFPPS